MRLLCAVAQSPLARRRYCATRRMPVPSLRLDFPGSVVRSRTRDPRRLADTSLPANNRAGCRSMTGRQVSERWSGRQRWRLVHVGCRPVRHRRCRRLCRFHRLGERPPSPTVERGAEVVRGVSAARPIHKRGPGGLNAVVNLGTHRTASDGRHLRRVSHGTLAVDVRHGSGPVEASSPIEVSPYPCR
jgi:hypothetical protein